LTSTLFPYTTLFRSRFRGRRLADLRGLRAPYSDGPVRVSRALPRRAAGTGYDGCARAGRGGGRSPMVAPHASARDDAGVGAAAASLPVRRAVSLGDVAPGSVGRAGVAA